MSLDTEKVVARLYREARVPRCRGLHPLRRLRAWWTRPRRRRRPIGPRLRRWARSHWAGLIIGGLSCVLWLFMFVHWYNKLFNLECNVQAAWAQVEAEQERRHHIQLDLIRMVVGYTRHERTLMTEVTDLRTRAAGTAAAPPAGATAGLESMSREQINELFPRIMLMAEQYPTLRASENFQEFAQELVDCEDRVTNHIHTFNDEVNLYTTAIGQFPGNFFAAVWGFESYGFYTPSPGTTTYHPIQYDPTASTTGPEPPPPTPPGTTK